MKWGRKKLKSAASSSSHDSIVTRVLPISWFFKFKQKRQSNQRNRGGFYFQNPSKSLPGGWKEGRFYSMGEDDAYWRISFSRERIPCRQSTGGMNMNPLWYDSELEFEVSVLGSKGETDVARSGGRRRNFDDMVSDIKRVKEMQGGGKDKSPARNDGEPPEILRPKDQNLTKLSSRVSREKRQERGPAERDVFPIEPERSVELEKDAWRLALSSSRKKKSNFRLTSVKEDNVYEEPLTNRKLLKEIKLKPDQPQKKQPTWRSTKLYSRKTNQLNNRVKAYSPRTECKIRALEDMKKSRMKLKKKSQGKGRVIGGETIFDSFAVVKSTSNPLRDFRESMVEMISEKSISRAEDLEELLACYLTLNCDAYHDLIIKVFRQVWSELNAAYTDYRIPDSQYFAY